ncbi:MAG TPA: NifU family protein [Bacteroidetes bacterium]|nr:NifU family protein [Bacteroidota bacterium]
MDTESHLTKEQIDKALDVIRPHIMNDGGDIEVVDINPKNEVLLKWKGACAVCDKRELTFKYGIKNYLLEALPELKDVIEL